MPQPVLTKYKQGELGADYPKDKPVGEKLDMSIQANYETRPTDFPKKKENKVEASFMKMANEKDVRSTHRKTGIQAITGPSAPFKGPHVRITFCGIRFLRIFRYLEK